VAAERQWTVNWSVKPVVEGDSLVALQSLYRDAIHRSIPPDDRNVGRRGENHSGATTMMSEEWPTTQGSPWFQLKEPTHEPIAYKGSYRGVKVYVTAEHMQELSGFTINILRNSPNVTTLLPGIPALNP
jgi:hypothetical protein